MASFDNPKLSNHIADDVPNIRTLLRSLAQLTPDSGNTDYPVGTKRFAETANGYEFQQFNGTGWVTLEKWNMDVQKVDGHSASTGTTASTIPVRDANGDLPGNITGNAKTASKAAALSAVNPIPMGGTGANTPEGARGTLGVPPTDHSSTGTDYGLGNATEYGHNKLSDATDSNLGADGGTAATPLAVKTAKAEAITAAGEALEAFVETQAAKDEAQDEAIAEAKSSADAASEEVTELDTTLRQLIAEELAKYLPLAGGTMTGTLVAKGYPAIVAPDNTDAVAICGGKSTSANDGAKVTFYGADDPNYAGQVHLQAGDATGWNALRLMPDGEMTVNGNRLSECCMMSPNYTNLTVGASGTVYTSPGDGWIYFGTSATGSDSSPTYISLIDYITGARFQYYRYSKCWLRAIMPVRQGQQFECAYTGTVDTSVLRFIRAVSAQ